MSLLRRLLYSAWYFRRPPWDSGITPPELLDFLSTRPAGKVIDLGCGTGTNVVTLAKLGWHVCGVDFISHAISQARQKARQAAVNVDLRVADVTRLDGINDSFDLALDLGCFHSLPEPEKEAYLNQLDRVLIVSGVWFVYGFLNQAGNQTGPGFTESDFQKVRARYRLLSRSDGFDRGQRRSAYFIYEKL